jgi:hypothetical protein
MSFIAAFGENYVLQDEIPLGEMDEAGQLYQKIWPAVAVDVAGYDGNQKLRTEGYSLMGVPQKG